jgi:hypothetical protein
MQSTSQTFLIVGVSGTEDFLQLTATPQSAQIDFPLITARQRTLEPKILQVAAELQLDFHETRGRNGGRFLDCDLRGTAREIADTCRELLTRVFGISEDGRLTFKSDGAI